MMIRVKLWRKYLSWPDTKAQFELSVEKGKVVDAKIIGYFVDMYGMEHQFVRWDNSHGKFHKDCCYKKGGGKEYIKGMTLNEAFIWATRDLIANWRKYKKEYIKNFIS